MSAGLFTRSVAGPAIDKPQLALCLAEGQKQNESIESMKSFIVQQDKYGVI